MTWFILLSFQVVAAGVIGTVAGLLSNAFPIMDDPVHQAAITGVVCYQLLLALLGVIAEGEK